VTHRRPTPALRLSRSIAAIALTATLVASTVPPVSQQPEPAPAPTQRQPEPAPWDAGLSALDPAKPQEYFELAEEVAADATNPGLRELARHLYVLAFELDRPKSDAPASSGRSRLGPSVCLGLAAIARRPEERRWLSALAQALDDRQSPGVAGGQNPIRATGVSDETALSLATAIGLSRSGEGRRAEGYLDRPGVAELLERYDADATAGSGLAAVVRRAIRDWPVCPQCQNRRVVRAGAKGEVALCDTCRGNPGPATSDEELARQLRVESSVLGGGHRSWASQVIADGGAPLRDLDPAELAATYNVDTSMTVWRDGKWAAPEGSLPAAPQNNPQQR
jgi:hypothetical protein